MQPAASRPNQDSFSLWRAIAGRAARVVVGGTLGVAALRKAGRPDEALRAIAHIVELAGLSASLIAPFLVVLILVELLLATLLLFDVCPGLSTRMSGMLLTVFSAWIGYLLVSGKEIGCGCGVRATWLRDADARWVSLGRNVLLLALCWLGGTGLRHQCQNSEPLEDHALPA